MIFPKPYSIGRKAYPIIGYAPLGTGYSVNPNVRSHIDNEYAYVIDGTQPFEIIDSITPKNRIALLWQTWGFQTGLAGWAFLLLPTIQPTFNTYVWKTPVSDLTAYDKITNSKAVGFTSQTSHRARTTNVNRLTTVVSTGLTIGDCISVTGVGGVGYNVSEAYIIGVVGNVLYYKTTSSYGNEATTPDVGGTITVTVASSDMYWEVTPDFIFENNSYTLYTSKGQGTATNAVGATDRYFFINKI